MAEQELVRQQTAVEVQQSAPMGITEIREQVNLIQQVMQQVMQKDEHYGLIPGCGKKPSLLKPGAEKLSLTFRLAPKYEITEQDLGNGHRNFVVRCILTHITTGAFIGEGVGSCSTMEGKYRYRVGEGEPTGKPVPKEYWTDRNQELLGGKGFQAKKIDGKWEIVRQGDKVEHDNPADYWNTCLKMGKKRAHVDAILTATAASDIFTQDIDDNPELYGGKAPTQQQQQAPADAEYEELPPRDDVPHEEGPDEKATKRLEHLRNIELWLLEMSGGEEEPFNALLKEVSEYTSTKTNSQVWVKDRDALGTISDKYLNTVYGRTKVKYEAWKGEQ